MVRIKHRYIIAQVLVEARYPSEFSNKDIIVSIREKIQMLSGDLGSGSFGNNSTIRLYDDTSKIFVLRVPREAELEVRLATCSVTSVKKSNAIIRVLAVAGCIRTCREKIAALFSIFKNGIADEPDAAAFEDKYAELIKACDL